MKRPKKSFVQPIQEINIETGTGFLIGEAILQKIIYRAGAKLYIESMEKKTKAFTAIDTIKTLTTLSNLSLLNKDTKSSYDEYNPSENKEPVKKLIIYAFCKINKP
jgi:hypothetical protein